MFEIADRLLARIDAGERVAVATAVAITGSAPRTVGTSMAVMSDGTVVGSISGGCVEGAVYELCLQVLDDGVPVLETFGFNDESAFAAGLSCGGRIEILATVVTSADERAVRALREAAAGRSARLLTVLGADRLGERLDCLDGCDGVRVFTESSEPPPRMIIFGAVEFAVALCTAASVLGYRVTVCDARPVFVTPERFPAADEIVIEWPPTYLARTQVDERTAIAILSHDDRYDTDLVEVALASPAFYVGAMGSRRTHDRRVAELVGRDASGLNRLHSPIGLDLGGSTPEETAVAILGEVLAVRAGASGSRLRETSGPIHRPLGAVVDGAAGAPVLGPLGGPVRSPARGLT